MEENKRIIIKLVPQKYNDDHAVRNVIHYIVTDKKTEQQRRYVGGKGVYYLDWKKWHMSKSEAKEMMKWYPSDVGGRVRGYVSFGEGELWVLWVVMLEMDNGLSGGYFLTCCREVKSGRNFWMIADFLEIYYKKSNILLKILEKVTKN